MRAGSDFGKELGERNGHWSEWHQRCCRLEESPGRGGRAAGIRSVALCHPRRQAAPQPRSVLASLLPDRPPPNADRQTTHRTCTAPAPSHEARTTLCHVPTDWERNREAGVTSVLISGTVLQPALLTSCYSTTIAQAGPQHSKNSTSTAQVDCGPVSVERYTHTWYGTVRHGCTVMELAHCGDRRVGRQDCQTLERCSPCPCRALQCNAVREGEGTERELGDLGHLLVRRGSPDFGQSV